MDNVWVAVADHSQAKIFGANTTNRSLNELQAFNHATARQTGEALHHEGHGSASADKFPKERDGEAFVENFTAFLEEQFRQKKFDSIILVCPAKTLGEVRKALSTNLKKAVSKEISKDLIHQSTSDVAKLIFA